MKRLRILLRRLARWCFGPVERAAPTILPFGRLSPERLRSQIAEATGLSEENVRIIPIRVRRCKCPECARRRKETSIQYRGPL